LGVIRSSTGPHAGQKRFTAMHIAHIISTVWFFVSVIGLFSSLPGIGSCIFREDARITNTLLFMFTTCGSYCTLYMLFGYHIHI
jgi:hypothetical protein